MPFYSQLIQKFPFVNVCLLNPYDEDIILESLENAKLTEDEYTFLAQTSVVYLTKDLEIITVGYSAELVNNLLNRQKFIRLLSEKIPETQKYLSGELLNRIDDTFSVYYRSSSDALHRHFLHGSIEDLLGYLKEEIKSWKICPQAQEYISPKIKQVSTKRGIYHSFLVPNFYKELYHFVRRENEKVLEKIEQKCNCKFSLSEKSPLFYCGYVLLEILFDPMYGNFAGCLTMLEELMHFIHPTVYFIKHKETIYDLGDGSYKVVHQSSNGYRKGGLDTKTTMHEVKGYPPSKKFNKNADPKYKHWRDDHPALDVIKRHIGNQDSKKYRKETNRDLRRKASSPNRRVKDENRTAANMKKKERQKRNTREQKKGKRETRSSSGSSRSTSSRVERKKRDKSAHPSKKSSESRSTNRSRKSNLKLTGDIKDNDGVVRKKPTRKREKKAKKERKGKGKGKEKKERKSKERKEKKKREKKEKKERPEKKTKSRDNSEDSKSERSRSAKSDRSKSSKRERSKNDSRGERPKKERSSREERPKKERSSKESEDRSKKDRSRSPGGRSPSESRRSRDKSSRDKSSRDKSSRKERSKNKSERSSKDRSSRKNKDKSEGSSDSSDDTIRRGKKDGEDDGEIEPESEKLVRATPPTTSPEGTDSDKSDISEGSEKENSKSKAKSKSKTKSPSSSVGSLSKRDAMKSKTGTKSPSRSTGDDDKADGTPDLTKDCEDELKNSKDRRAKKAKKANATERSIPKKGSKNRENLYDPTPYLDETIISLNTNCNVKEYVALLKEAKWRCIPYHNEIDSMTVPSVFSDVNPEVKGEIQSILHRLFFQTAFDLYLAAMIDNRFVRETLMKHIALLLKCWPLYKDPQGILEELKIRRRLLDINGHLLLNGNCSLISKEMRDLSDDMFSLESKMFPDHQSKDDWNLMKLKESRVIYHSFFVGVNSELIEPFLRKEGDRRITKIERSCHCRMVISEMPPAAMAFGKKMVEIYYDIVLGNHFGCISMLTHLLHEAADWSVRKEVHSYRTIMCFASGERLVLEDISWLQNTYPRLRSESEICPRYFTWFDQMGLPVDPEFAHLRPVSQQTSKSQQMNEKQIGIEDSTTAPITGTSGENNNYTNNNNSHRRCNSV